MLQGNVQDIHALDIIQTVDIYCKVPGPWFNINMFSHQYRQSHYGDKTILRPSYLHNGISYTGKMISLYWIEALVSIHSLVFIQFRTCG